MGSTYLEHHKTILHSGAVAAGVTLITPTNGVDTTGYERAIFIIAWGAIAAGGVQSPEIHGSSDDGAGDAYAGLTGTNVTVADSDDDKLTIIEVYRPVEKWLKCLINRATANAEVDSIICILYGGTASTATQDSTVQSSEAHASPAEGTP